ncbi:LppA family lipoprotein [Amycolatopsis mongoliensis]|uniref:LppA family lipoprotein n=1 Tax=Amycolatopsis mongoliensis TaxID=715475 RepID=A0A9Y2JJX6_9PSEU|nr:LppA family lipoprotein [Amycolatopsis sp. 4-36]WIX98646.1 LppA family lipoprotein [Amycolatopsis sp. 4-36]
MPTRTSLAALVAAGLLLAAACDDGGQYLGAPTSENTMTNQDQYAELMRRPSIEEMISRYETLREQLRSDLTQQLGVVSWAKQDGSPSRTECVREYPQVRPGDAEKRHLDTWFSPTAIAPADWEKAKSIVSQAAGAQGFTKTKLVIDRSDDLQLDLADSFGAELSFGSTKNTIIALTTGCHMAAEVKKQAGSSSAPTTK